MGNSRPRDFESPDQHLLGWKPLVDRILAQHDLMTQRLDDNRPLRTVQLVLRTVPVKYVKRRAPRRHFLDLGNKTTRMKTLLDGILQTWVEPQGRPDTDYRPDAPHVHACRQVLDNGGNTRSDAGIRLGFSIEPSPGVAERPPEFRKLGATDMRCTAEKLFPTRERSNVHHLIPDPRSLIPHLRQLSARAKVYDCRLRLQPQCCIDTGLIVSNHQ